MAGGINSDDTISTTELYDSRTGIWTTTGSLNTARYAHTATLLRNGMVLLAGGLGLQGTTSSAELYDPVSGIWTLTGDLNTARSQHTATLLPNGVVLVAGGLENSFTALRSAELFRQQ